MATKLLKFHHKTRSESGKLKVRGVEEEEDGGSTYFYQLLNILKHSTMSCICPEPTISHEAPERNRVTRYISIFSP